MKHFITFEQFNSCSEFVQRRILSDLQSNYEARREIIATAALQGMLADSTRDGPPSLYANTAVEIADALIIALREIPIPVGQHISNAES